MRKIAIISSCSECPECDFMLEACDNFDDKKVHTIPDFVDIPDWCPLPTPEEYKKL